MWILFALVHGKLYGHWLRAMKKTVRTQRVLRLRALEQGLRMCALFDAAD